MSFWLVGKHGLDHGSTSLQSRSAVVSLAENLFDELDASHGVGLTLVVDVPERRAPAGVLHLMLAVHLHLQLQPQLTGVPYLRTQQNVTKVKR